MSVSQRKGALIIPCKDLPIAPPCDIVVRWDVGENIGIQWDVFTLTGFLIMHPWTLVRNVQDFYGSDRALDLAKIFLHDHIDNLFNQARQRPPVLTKK